MLVWRFVASRMQATQIRFQAILFSGFSHAHRALSALTMRTALLLLTLALSARALELTPDNYAEKTAGKQAGYSVPVNARDAAARA